MLGMPDCATSSIHVIAAYLFVDIDDTPALHARLATSAKEAQLKGTVLLAKEGINLCLAGSQEALAMWIKTLRSDPRFASIEVKWSQASALPFRFLRVKVKREIIRMNQPTIRPSAQRASAVTSAQLKRWLDAGRCDKGRPVVFLDTRNNFEVDVGSFTGALDWRLGKFSDFPEALAQHRAALEGKTVVSYCTGGIRCEKAVLWMQSLGISHVHQLDGGILKYFEEQGSAAQAPHFEGACFVFDERGALDAGLSA